MSVRVTPDLCDKYIRGTEKGAIVQNVQVFLCSLTSAVIRGISSGCGRVYINTRVLKHVYDKRPAEEFDFLTCNIHTIVKYPDAVYKNKNGKKGDYCFIKELKNMKYMCSVQVVRGDDASAQCEIVTFFRLQKESYLKSYDLLWEWKGGDLHRSAFDADLHQPNRTPQ
jgi:hypothetical protein